MTNKFSINEIQKDSENNKKLTADQKIIRSLSSNDKTFSELKEELKLPPSTLSSAIQKLTKANLIDEIENKKYSLISNPTLERIILEECPFRDQNELNQKIKNRIKQNEQKFDQKSIEISVQKLENEQSFIRSKNNSYTLSDYGCIRIQHCIECKKKVEDGSTLIITLRNREYDSNFHYVIHPECYHDNIDRYTISTNKINSCNHCGLALDYDELLSQQTKFNWMNEIQFYLNKDEKYNLENRDRDQIVTEVNQTTGEKLEGKDIQFVTKLHDNPGYYSAEKMTFRVKITEKNIEKYLENFRTLTVRSKPTDYHVTSKTLIMPSDIKIQKIQSASDLDFKMINTVDFSITDKNYSIPLSFSVLEKFYMELTKIDDPKIFKSRINELFSILVQIRDKKRNEAKIYVDKLFEPLSIITAHSKTPNYDLDYSDELGGGLMEWVTGIQRVVKEKGKTFHPYCATIVEANQKKESKK